MVIGEGEALKKVPPRPRAPPKNKKMEKNWEKW